MNQKNYTKLSNLFRILAMIWGYFFITIIIFSIISFFLTAPSLLAGWKKVMEIFSPFNITNLIAMIIFSSPTLAFYKLHEHFDKKILVKKSNTVIKKKFCFDTIAVAIITFCGGLLTLIALAWGLYAIYKIKKKKLSGMWFAIALTALNIVRITIYLVLVYIQ